LIAVIDYGAGNLRSVVNAFEAIGQKPRVTGDPGDLAAAAAIVLPGVGAFGDGMKTLRQMNLVEALNDQVIGKKKPYLGICLGLHFLAQNSFEHGSHEGLGWIAGSVQKIVPGDDKCRIPHMGWNNIHLERPSPLFEGLEAEPTFYFVHSYHLVVAEGWSEVVTSTCRHGITITASVQKDNIHAVQFHPEKSQRNGLTVLENFVKLI
jgi:glutamine amidotransferase